MEEEIVEEQAAENSEELKEQNDESGEEENSPELSVEEQLEAALKESADLRDKMLRVAADSENFKKRMERERLTALKYAGENIFREILPALDNLERALTTGIIEGADAEKNLAALIEGVELTKKSLVSTLEKFEVKPVESVGEPFNPAHHEALTMEKSGDVPANHIINEYEKGYYYKDRLLRAAKVIVSSGE